MASHTENKRSGISCRHGTGTGRFGLEDRASEGEMGRWMEGGGERGRGIGDGDRR